MGGSRLSLRFAFLPSLGGGITTLGVGRVDGFAGSVDMFLKEVEGLEIGWSKLLQACDIFPFGASDVHGSQKIIQDSSRMGTGGGFI